MIQEINRLIKEEETKIKEWQEKAKEIEVKIKKLNEDGELDISDKIDSELVDDRVRQLTDAISRLQKALKVCEGKVR